jgi:proteasome assembly chaperone 2
VLFLFLLAHRYHRRRIQWTSSDKSTPLLNEDFLRQFPALTADDNNPIDDVSIQGANGAWASVRGAGLAPTLLSSCTHHAIHALALLLHCAEGNNVPDAVFFASCVVQYLSLHTTVQSFRLVLPPSWAQLYGREPAIALYS